MGIFFLTFRKLVDKGAQTRTWIHEGLRRLLSGLLQLFIFFHTLIFDWGGCGEKWVLAIQPYILKAGGLNYSWNGLCLRRHSEGKVNTEPLQAIAFIRCSNIPALMATASLRMTMNQATPRTALFSQPYIDVKHMAGMSQPPHFITLQHLWDWGCTFHLHHQKRPNCLWSSSIASLK